MLQEKTRGNCTQEEQRLLDNALTELRFRFVLAYGAASQESGGNSARESSRDAGRREGQRVRWQLNP